MLAEPVQELLNCTLLKGVWWLREGKAAQLSAVGVSWGFLLSTGALLAPDSHAGGSPTGMAGGPLAIARPCYYWEIETYSLWSWVAVKHPQLSLFGLLGCNLLPHQVLLGPLPLWGHCWG